MKPTEYKVAVIDDGINEEYYGVKSLSFNVEITPDQLLTQRCCYKKDIPSHGTICAAIIQKYAPDAKIGSVKILDLNRKTAKIDSLITAINWCVQNKIIIINLSLGTVDFHDFKALRTCINSASEAGSIIIAACNNNNNFTYPACMTNVISVKTSKKYIDNMFSMNECLYEGIDFLASSRHCLVDINDNSNYSPLCNSFAVPLITAEVYNILQEHPNFSLEEIKMLLNQKSNKISDSYNPYMTLSVDWVPDSQKREAASVDKTVKKIIQNNVDSVNIILSNDEISNIPKKFSDTKVKFWTPVNDVCKDCKIRRCIKKIDIPVVAINFYCEDYLIILNNLNKEFLNNGYFSLGVSDNSMGVLYDIEYKDILSHGLKESVCEIYQKYKPDIILVGLYSECKKTNAAGCEISIVAFDQEEIQCKNKIMIIEGKIKVEEVCKQLIFRLSN